MEFAKKHFTMLLAVSASFVFGLIMGVMVGSSVDLTGEIVSLDTLSYSADR